ncbi:MAG: hypothetical protein PHC48_05345 [Prevotella sp.]|nr:hypothetical protein [Prevotella sp.]
MSDYCNYKYEFELSNQRWAFKENGEPMDAEAMRKKWSETLSNGAALLLNKMVRGEHVPVSCYIIGKQEDVFVLMVHNVKSIKQWRELAEKPDEIESFPHCKVIVDNRKGVQQILVEKNEAFNSKPDGPIKIIKNYIDQQYAELECTVKMSKKVLVGDVWKTVNEFRKNGHNVTSVSFKIGSQEQVDATNEPEAELVKTLVKYNQIMGGAGAMFKSFANSKTDMDFCELNEDCVNLVKVIANNGYDLEVHFSDHSVYRSKKQTIATFPLSESFIYNFQHNTRTMDNSLELVNWLDYIRTNSENYCNVEVKSNKSVA